MFVIATRIDQNDLWDQSLLMLTYQQCQISQIGLILMVNNTIKILNMKKKNFRNTKNINKPF